VRIVEQWRSINTTLGVLCLVRVGDCPARCPDNEVEALRSRMDATGVIRLPPPPAPKARHVFAKGERVKILAGPLEGFAALHTGLSAAEKEILLIGMLGAQRRIAVPGHLVAPQ
jgi:transcription antitermination factor NusG